MSGYSKWIAKVEPSYHINSLERKNVKELIQTIILIETAEQKSTSIIDSINSIVNQSCQNWELLVAVEDTKRINAICNDRRIRVFPNLGKCSFVELANSLVVEASGDLVTFITQGDLLSQYAVEYMTNSLDMKIIVTDEDFLDASGDRSSPFFKPDLNRDYLLNSNYFSRGLAYNRVLFIELGGFNKTAKNFYHEFALKAVAQLDDGKIIHIDKILFHLSQQKNFEIGRVQHELLMPIPLITVIIPTKDQVEILEECINGLLNQTSYEQIEIIIVDNQSVENKTLMFLEQVKSHSNIRVISYDKSFNYSDMNNIAAKKANGDLLCFLNNDISVINDGWLTEMVSEAIRPEIGCVGAKLFYPDGTIQHAGVTLGLRGYASHAHKGFLGDSTGYFNRLQVTHNVSAVTGACMVVRKELFELVGGLDAVNLKIAYNDVDFCLKVREAGYRNLFTPHAQLIHHESKSRGKKRGKKEQKVLRAESEFFREKWGDLLTSDPAYNKNLTLLKEDFSLGFDRLEH